MKFSTQRYLTLGMALTADKTTMERRIRGVFARKSSAKTAKILALALSLALGIGCFTTACRPLQEGVGEPAPTPTATQEDFEIALQEQSEDTSVSFLEGLTESADAPGPIVSRIDRETIALDDYSTLTYSAEVVVPEASDCGIARLKKHSFNDAELTRYMDCFAPGAKWLVQDQSVPFSLDAVADGDPFSAAFTNDEGYEVRFSATRNGGEAFYTRYPGVMAYSDYDMTDYADINDAGFDQQWPISSEEALSVAERTIHDLGVEDVALAGMERAVTYLPGIRGTTVDTRGWMFYFSNELNGLVCDGMNYVGYTYHNNDLPNYQTSMWSMLRVFVDETGVGEVEWQKTYDQTETLFQNVTILSPEEIADRMTNYYQSQCEQSSRATETAMVVTEIRLCLTAISEYQSSDTASDFDEELGVGLLVPCWEIETRTNWGAVYSSGLTTVYVFDAVHGGILASKDYRKDPVI